MVVRPHGPGLKTRARFSVAHVGVSRGPGEDSPGDILPGGPGAEGQGAVAWVRRVGVRDL